MARERQRNSFGGQRYTHQDTSNAYPPAQTGVGEQIEIEFVRTVQYENEGRHKGPTFYKGRRYSFDAASGFAQRWIKRGAAFDTAGPPPDPVDELPGPAPLQKGGASEGVEEYRPSDAGGL